MNKQTWDILTEVLELEKEAQVEKLKELCGESKNLFDELTNLIFGDDNIENWWDTNARFSEELLFDASMELSQNFPTDEELLGQNFGAYTVTSSIGSGGMGKVFLAERSDGAFERKVAIKVMSFHLNLKGIQARFFKEQKILASLNHPGIAQLYDANISEKGTPYLVMEYIEGEILTDYVKKNKLELEEKIELFLKICEAVEYAHRNLVIHKDLKPSNILVQENSIPKVLDFGVSGLIEDVSEQNEIEDQAKSFTLKYSAPEQILDSNITTSADIYSLGILFFELLAGTHPLTLSEMDRKQAEEAALQESFLLASEKSGNRKLKGELDSIISKATQKKEELRYQTVIELAEDLKRFQKNIPVQARKSSSFERGVKFLKRNPISSTLTSIMIVGVILFSLFYNIQIKKERDIAQLEAEKAIVTKDYLLDLFKKADPLNKPGEEQTVGDFLELNIESLSGLDNQPAVKEEAAYTLAQVAFNIGAYEQAESLFVESYRLNRELNQAQTIEQANALDRIGNIYVQLADYKLANNYFDSALTIKTKLLSPNSDEIATSYSMIGGALAHLGYLDSAEVLLDKSLKIYSEKKQLNPEKLIANIEATADLSREEQDYKRSARLLEENLVLRKEYLSEDKNGMALSYNNLGFSYKSLEKYPEAIQAYKNSLEILENVYGKEHPTTLTILSNLASVYMLSKETVLAEDVLFDRLERVKASFGESHWRLGQAYAGIGGFYYDTGQFFKSVEHYQEAIQIYSQALGEDHFWTNRAKLNLAVSGALSGEMNEGKQLFTKSLSEIKKNLNGRLTYYNYSGIEVIQQRLTNHDELSEFSIAISDFLAWHNATFPN